MYAVLYYYPQVLVIILHYFASHPIISVFKEGRMYLYHGKLYLLYVYTRDIGHNQKIMSYKNMFSNMVVVFPSETTRFLQVHVICSIIHDVLYALFALVGL